MVVFNDSFKWFIKIIHFSLHVIIDFYSKFDVEDFYSKFDDEDFNFIYFIKLSFKGFYKSCS